MRGPLQDFQGDNYERPNQAWLCGLSDEGAPCPVGPVKRGRCAGATACRPIRNEDRWVCNRSAARGGVCETGPSAEGECCHVYQCTPLRSLRQRRGRFVLGCLLATLGGLCLAMSSNWRNKILKPGELSVQHAQLLQRGEKTEQCASCHTVAELSLGEWLNFVDDAKTKGAPSQSALCMECHQQQIEPGVALWAHNVDPTVLLAKSDPNASRWLDPTQELACSTCHKEHNGAMHDLTWMSDQACQACHQQTYESFATDHPEFEAWPEQRRTRIAFDHGAHQLKYFPKEKQDFTCATCHAQDRDGAFQKTLGYEATCGKCHDSKIAASWDAGVSLFALPMIDAQALQANKLGVGQWPESASSEFDGALSPMTKLLLAADEQANSALAVLGADFDFFDVDSEDRAQLLAAGEIIWTTKRLLHEVSTQGQDAIRVRIEKVIGRKLSQEEFSALTARLSPENLSIMTERWLTQLPVEMKNGPAAAGAEQANANRSLLDRQTVRQRITAGGWFSDEATLSLRYQPTGHADPWVTAWIDVLTEAANGPYSRVAKPLLKQMMQPTALGQCGSCHSLDQAEGRYEVQWFAKRVEDMPPSFTRFSHAPHVTQKQLADCQSCHQINPLAKVMESYKQSSPTEFQCGFQRLTKQNCAECHTPHGAGDSCMQCHSYHVGGEW